MKNVWAYYLWLVLWWLFILWVCFTTWYAPRYELWFECWVIVTKMNILTDTGTWEYRRLSDKYDTIGCQYDNPDEDIVLYIQEM